jgi:hypothetical protein
VIWCVSSTATEPVHAVTEIKSLRSAVTMRSDSTNNIINIEDDNNYDDDGDDNDNLSTHTYVHIYNKHYFQCHKIVSYIVVDLHMGKLIICVLNHACYSRVWLFLSSHLAYYVRERHYVVFC